MNELMLKDIYIGYVDGQKEASSQEHNFADLFYTKNSKYEQIIKEHNFIISGRKGTGKTILAKYMENEKEKEDELIKIKYINLPNEIKQHEFTERNFTDIKEDEYNLFPKYYILKTATELILENKVGLFKYLMNSNGNLLKRIKKYYHYAKSFRNLKKIHSERYPKGNFFSDNIHSEVGNSQMSQIKVEYKEASAQREYNQHESRKRDFRFKNYSALIDEIENDVKRCVKVSPILLIFDDVDDIKNYMDNMVKVKKFLIGLIKSINEINKSLLIENHKNKCIMIIRDDILDSLNSLDSNLNKIVADAAVNLDWIGNNQTDMLIDMICNKIKKSNKKFDNVTTENVLKLFIKDRSYKAIIDYIINRGFGRPRDIILYLNIIVRNNQYAKNISFSLVKNALNEYSNQFWNEIKNELSFFYSEKQIDEIEKLLGFIGKNVLKYDDIKEYINTHKDDYTEIGNLKKLLSDLYKYGMIGNKRYKKTASYYYRKDGRNYFCYDEAVMVHRGLLKVLNL
ncbi:MAG: hypothetical protein Q4D26_09060 [Clostridia bacterium]|nr:hypothetical protein [Clostridia bacterium]